MCEWKKKKKQSVKQKDKEEEEAMAKTQNENETGKHTKRAQMKTCTKNNVYATYNE